MGLPQPHPCPTTRHGNKTQGRRALHVVLHARRARLAPPRPRGRHGRRAHRPAAQEAAAGGGRPPGARRRARGARRAGRRAGRRRGRGRRGRRGPGRDAAAGRRQVEPRRQELRQPAGRRQGHLRRFPQVRSSAGTPLGWSGRLLAPTVDSLMARSVGRGECKTSAGCACCACCACCVVRRASGVLVVGTSSGLMDLYQLPGFEVLHALSVSRERVTSVAFNKTGDWVAGAPRAAWGSRGPGCLGSRSRRHLAFSAARCAGQKRQKLGRSGAGAWALPLRRWRRGVADVLACLDDVLALQWGAPSWASCWCGSGAPRAMCSSSRGTTTTLPRVPSHPTGRWWPRGATTARCALSTREGRAWCSPRLFLAGVARC